MSSSPWEQAFEQGYICAVANIIRTHDEPTIAKDVLAAQMPKDWSKVDKLDYQTLHKAGLAPALKRRRARMGKSGDA